MIRFLRTCFGVIPAPLAHHLYCQVIQRMPAIHRHPDLFTNAALKFAPGAQMRLNPTDVAHSRLAWLGVYEDALSDAIVSLARQVGGKLLDVGANYGYFSLLWCSARPENSAIAIEASPRNLAALRDNVNRNGLSDRITVCDWAASNITGSVSFELGPLEQTGGSGRRKRGGLEKRQLSAPCDRQPQIGTVWRGRRSDDDPAGIVKRTPTQMGAGREHRANLPVHCH